MEGLISKARRGAVGADLLVQSTKHRMSCSENTAGELISLVGIGLRTVPAEMQQHGHLANKCMSSARKDAYKELAGRCPVETPL